MKKEQLINELRYALPSARILQLVSLAVVDLGGELIVLKARPVLQSGELEQIEHFSIYEETYFELQGKNIEIKQSAFNRRGQKAIVEYLASRQETYQPFADLDKQLQEAEANKANDSFLDELADLAVNAFLSPIIGSKGLANAKQQPSGFSPFTFAAGSGKTAAIAKVITDELEKIIKGETQDPIKKGETVKDPYVAPGQTVKDPSIVPWQAVNPFAGVAESKPTSGSEPKQKYSDETLVFILPKERLTSDSVEVALEFGKEKNISKELREKAIVSPPFTLFESANTVAVLVGGKTQIIKARGAVDLENISFEIYDEETMKDKDWTFFKGKNFLIIPPKK